MGQIWGLSCFFVLSASVPSTNAAGIQTRATPASIVFLCCFLKQNIQLNKMLNYVLWFVLHIWHNSLRIGDLCKHDHKLYSLEGQSFSFPAFWQRCKGCFPLPWLELWPFSPSPITSLELEVTCWNGLADDSEETQGRTSSRNSQFICGIHCHRRGL